MKSVLIVLAVLFLLFPLETHPADLEKPKLTIVYVHSYDFNHPCTGPQHKGINSRIMQLGIRYDLRVRAFLMEAKVQNVDPAKRREIAIKIISKIKELKPDYIFTTDDVAFSYVGVPLAAAGYKVLASGINKTLDDYIKSGDISIAAARNVISSEETIRLDNIFSILDKARIRPNTWYILYDNSETSFYMMKNYEKELAGKGKVEFIKVETIDELRIFLDSVKGFPPGVIVATVQSLYNRDLKRYISKDKFFVEFTAGNTKHIELAGNPMFSKFGYSISCGPDFEYMGARLADHFVSEVLTKGFKSITLQPITVVSINIKRLKQLGYTSIADGNFKTIRDMFESY